MSPLFNWIENISRIRVTIEVQQTIQTIEKFLYVLKTNSLCGQTKDFFANW